MSRTGVVRDKRYMLHQMGEFHPESPERLEVIYRLLDDPEVKDLFEEIPARKAQQHELLAIHSKNYVDLVAATEGKKYTYLDPDTQTSAGSYEAALLAAGGVCEAIKKVEAGDLKNALALIRPPGHHAEKSRAMGFCLFNNIAIGARYAQNELHRGKILIVDWDLHHGNGTQHSFEDDPSVLYFSTHQYPYYPGTGSFKETGIGEGEGYTVNIPLSAGCGDFEYLALFEKILTPIALDFNPDFVLVSAGFDIYRDDPLGGMNVSPGGFAALTRSVMEIADRCCSGKAVFVLEGGYSLQGLRDSVKAVLRELSGQTKTMVEPVPQPSVSENIRLHLKQLELFQRRYWKAF